MSLTPFTFPTTGAQVRAVTIADEPWFVVADVCRILGLTNPTVAADRVDPDALSTAEVVDSMGRRQSARVASEPGLYELIFQSRKAEAREFRRWVTREVLPSIRRTGSYSTTPVVPQSYAEALRAAADAVEARQVAEERAAALEPAAQAWDVLADARGDYSLRDAAQILSRDPHITTGQNRLAKYLKRIRWTDGDGRPYQAQVDAGRLVRRSVTWEHPRTREETADYQVRITAKGLRALRESMVASAQLALTASQ